MWNRPFQIQRIELLGLLAILMVGVLVRIAVFQRYGDELNSDPDIYVALADGLVAGRGYSIPETTTPTAFRPPLYPLLLTATRAELPFVTDQRESQRWRLALLQLTLSLTTIPLVWLAARNLELSASSRLFATVVVAFDPLLLRYLCAPMTEVFGAWLMALWLWQLSRIKVWTPASGFMSGIIFGLCVLARPTFWSMGILLTVACVALHWRRGSKNLASKNSSSTTTVPTTTVPTNTVSTGVFRIPTLLATLSAVALCVMPWVARNLLMMDQPVLMTTHGGYTLLLGNNQAFYTEVVRQPFGTIWDGSKGPGQASWYAQVKADMTQAGVIGELEQDRFQQNLARQTILNEPVTFIRACVLKFLWFWNVAPHASAENSLSPRIWWSIACYYGLLWIFFLIGLWKSLSILWSRPHEGRNWLPVISLVVAMSLTHLVYWSDARMRAPVVPAIALLAALGISRKKVQFDHESVTSHQS